MNQLKKKESITKYDLIKKIEDRIEEYKLAIEYFQKNDLPLRKIAGENDIKILDESLKKIKSGNFS